MGEDGFKKAPIGAGPYRFVSFTPGVELVLEAFDGYWRKTPSVKRLVFKAVPDAATRLAMLKRGEADIAYAIDGELGEEVRRTPGLDAAADAVRRATHWLLFADQWDSELAVARPARAPGRHARASTGRRSTRPRRLGFSKITGSIIPTSFDFYWQPPVYPYDPRRRPSSCSPRPGTRTGFDAGDLWCDASTAAYAEPALNYLQAASASGPGCARSSGRRFLKAYQEKKLKNIVYGLSGIFGNAATRIGAVRGLERRLRLRRLSRHRRAVPGAGDRARSEEARGDPASHPAADPRQGHVLPIWQLAAHAGVRPRVAESGLGLIADYPWSAPYEDVKLKAK